jgi:hypothetical protein
MAQMKPKKAVAVLTLMISNRLPDSTIEQDRDIFT